MLVVQPMIVVTDQEPKLVEVHAGVSEEEDLKSGMPTATKKEVSKTADDD